MRLNWGSAFLPGDLQASSINTSTPTVDGMILNIRNDYFGRAEQRRELDLVQKLNAMHSQKLQKDEQLEARIEAFEMAFRMQTEATDAFDLQRNRRVSGRCTATRRRDDSCSSRGGWSSAACGSCRSAPAAGTITRTSRPPADERG